MSIILDRFIRELRDIISEYSFQSKLVSVSARALTPDEAIGDPAHDDYPLLKGKERMMEAVFQNAKGQAFSDQIGNFSGSLYELINLPMDSNFNRALLVATANAVLRKIGMISKSCHCKNRDPERCASYVRDALAPFSPKRIGMIGNQPRLVEAIARDFELRVCDRDPETIGTMQSGVLVEDSELYEDIKKWADLLFATGTTLVNDTIDNFRGDVPVIYYGVTISGAAELLGLNQFCPLGT